jgi:hypothetical protein
MINRRILFLASALTLSGCEDFKAVDQCLRREVFKECLAELPAGPQFTDYNDWSEVVAECSQSSQYMSVRTKSYIKPECQ